MNKMRTVEKILILKYLKLPSLKKGYPNSGLFILFNNLSNSYHL